MPRLRILVVDDHEMIRRVLKFLLGSRPEWQVCGEAANGKEGVLKAEELQPDLVLMDITMPEMNGVEATRRILKQVPSAKIIIVSQNELAVIRRRDVGAAAYVAKSDLSRDLLKTIDDVFAQP
jgi:DNA-binding NarL/FixJ family response regulator